MPLRITKIKCPSCKGTGTAPIFGFGCLWCHGSNKLPVATAMYWADQTVALAISGYICGDHDWEDRNKMLAEADAVCKFLGKPIIAPEYAR